MLQVSETSLFRKELVEPNEKYYIKLPIGAANIKQKAIFLKSEDAWLTRNAEQVELHKFLSLIYC